MKTIYFLPIILLLASACGRKTQPQDTSGQYQDTAPVTTASIVEQEPDTVTVVQEVESFHYMPNLEKEIDGTLVNKKARTVELPELPDFPEVDPGVNAEHYRRRLNHRMQVEFSERPQNRMYVFYYTPGITSREYPFLQLLGDDHNMLNYVFSGEKEMHVLVPDSIYPGSKLMFRSLGYESHTVDLDDVSKGSCISVQLIPKMYNTHVYLKKKDDKIVIASIHNESPFSPPFYGECKTVYHFSEFGVTHADPDCAFLCLARCYPEFYLSQVSDVLTRCGEDLGMLYSSLQNGQKCSFLFASDKEGDTTIHLDSVPNDLQHFSKLVQDTKWSVKSADGKVFQSRMNFLLADS